MIIGVGVTDAGALFDAAGGVLSRAINHGEVGTHDVAGVSLGGEYGDHKLVVAGTEWMSSDAGVEVERVRPGGSAR